MKMMESICLKYMELFAQLAYNEGITLLEIIMEWEESRGRENT